MRINYIASQFSIFDGYGSWGINKIRGLLAKGITATPVLLKALEMPGWLQRQAGIDLSALNIATMPPDRMPPMPGRLWGDSMCEDTDLQPGGAEAINDSCERLIVPCQHNAEVFKARGVTVPIHVVHGGINPAEFPLVEHFPDRSWTWMCLGDRGSRKGMDLAWASMQAFPRDKYPDMRWVVKMRAGNGFEFLKDAVFPDHRISIWREDVAQRSDVYVHTDCFLFPSKGEGWGLPPREAAAMGIPTIVSRHTGLEVGIDHWATVTLNKFQMQNSQCGTPDGQWYVPETDELVEAMRWVYEHRDEARVKARQAALWLRENQTWEHSTQQLLTLIREYSSWLS